MVDPFCNNYCCCVIQKNFLKTLYFKIIKDSQKVAKTVQRGPMCSSPSFPQWLHTTKLEYQNQEIGIGRNCIYIVHIVLFHFITCIEFVTYYHNQETELFHHHHINVHFKIVITCYLDLSKAHETQNIPPQLPHSAGLALNSM